MNAIFYPAIFHPEETGYSVEIPDIEGCFTQGDTMDEAVRMAQDAIGLMLEDCKVCPEPSVPSSRRKTRSNFVSRTAVIKSSIIQEKKSILVLPPRMNPSCSA